MAATTISGSSLLICSSATSHRRVNLLCIRRIPLFLPKRPSLKTSSVKPLITVSLNPASISPKPNSPPNPLPNSPLISNSTKTLATLFAISVSLSSKIAQIISDSLIRFKARVLTPTPEELQTLQFLQDNVLCTVGPLFFAASRLRTKGTLSTPLTVVAAGMSKWLNIYSGVLLLRVLLSWFPNIPWDRQPLSALRDLCDPYLNLFRNIVPPLLDTLDVSPIFAFIVLGVLGSLLKELGSSTPKYSPRFSLPSLHSTTTLNEIIKVKTNMY
ncbi:hypothetical protein Cgig2_012780 [Carnegiea gigantea]|uniref:YGGT family protein n=1 Tax=Carnegiea gigantea TaxID=171969 RepID=A0A9Q1KBB5_9CARY|nr:hypothetical protein Cgig2_012780 [Carnegiea gigantea]